MQKPTQALNSVKDQGNTFDLNPKWARTLPSLIYFSLIIYRVHPKSKYQSSISGQLKEYFGRSKGERSITHALLEVTSLDAALTGNDVTWSHVIGSDVITGSMFCAWPKVHSCAFFLTIVVVKNVPLFMTGSSMATGCDVTENDVTGIIRPNVGDSPCCVILFDRSVV